jgi:DNA replication protein DnaC
VDAASLVGDYESRFENFYRQGLHDLVPTPLSRSDANVSVEELVDGLARRRNTQLVGLSGSGKSHLARHIMLTALQRQLLPVFVRASA